MILLIEEGEYDNYNVAGVYNIETALNEAQLTKAHVDWREQVLFDYLKQSPVETLTKKGKLKDKVYERLMRENSFLAYVKQHFKVTEEEFMYE